MLEAMSTTGHSEDIQLYTVEHGIRRMSLYGGRVSQVRPPLERGTKWHA